MVLCGLDNPATRSEVKAKISATRLRHIAEGRINCKHSEETKLKIGLGNRGKIISDESRKKQSESMKYLYHMGFKNWNAGKHVFVGQDNPFYGKSHSVKAKNILSVKYKRRVAAGWKHPNFGKHLPRNVCDKISGTLIAGYKEGRIIPPNHGLSGDSHPAWRGGVSFEPYSPEFNDKLKESVRNYFGNECILCHVRKSGLHVHHINCDKHDNSFVNLISLCCYCHNMMKSKFREFWMVYLSTYREEINRMCHNRYN